METRDLELIILGIVLAKPELLADLPVIAGGQLAELAAGRLDKMQKSLGNHVPVAAGKTCDNVLSEWRRRCEHTNRVAAATMALRMAQMGTK